MNVRSKTRLRRNTIQIQSNEYLGYNVEMNRKEASEKPVALTTGGTPAMVASKSKRML